MDSERPSLGVCRGLLVVSSGLALFGSGIGYSVCKSPWSVSLNKRKIQPWPCMTLPKTTKFKGMIG